VCGGFGSNTGCALLIGLVVRSLRKNVASSLRVVIRRVAIEAGSQSRWVRDCVTGTGPHHVAHLRELGAIAATADSNGSPEWSYHFTSSS
jgi:hypothetical protein